MIKIKLIKIKMIKIHKSDQIKMITFNWIKIKVVNICSIGCKKQTLYHIEPNEIALSFAPTCQTIYQLTNENKFILFIFFLRKYFFFDKLLFVHIEFKFLTLLCYIHIYFVMMVDKLYFIFYFLFDISEIKLNT